MPASSGKNLLIVDDDRDLRTILGDILADEGYQVALAESGEKAMRRLEGPDGHHINLVLTDLKMPGMGGHQLFRDCIQRWPHIPVLILTAHGTVDEALHMIREGAYDYIAKPYNTQDLLMRISRALEHEQLMVENQQLRALVKADRRFVESNEPSMKQVLARIDAAAVTDFPIVLMGESGTGKEVLARLAHSRSQRSTGPFVPVNCGAIPRELFESELFGHVRGAFTGATADRKGLFEEASGGTLFLDEIGEIAPEHQVKLLRALQEGEIKRVGDNLQRKIDTRIIAASNRDLQAMVRAGTFREDLYYRICVMPMPVPPLRARRGDILPLAAHFLERERTATGRNVTGFSRSALAKLMAYDWPGNIRQLENKVRQSLILASGEVINDDEILLDEELTPAFGSPSGAASAAPAPRAAQAPTLPLNEARLVFEKDYLVGLLRRHRGNATSAAREAGKHRSELYALLKKHGIAPGEFRDESVN